MICSCSHFLFLARGLAQSRPPKILWDQGMQEVSSSQVHLREGASLSQSPVSNAS